MTTILAVQSRTTWVCWYQKGRTILDLNQERDGGLAVLILNQPKVSTMFSFYFYVQPLLQLI